MSIEFSCFQCGKLLRVGDEAAGKDARCPSCGTVQKIPSAPLDGSPFGALPSITTPHGSEANPYQAPIELGTGTTMAPAPPRSSGRRPIQPTIISLSEPIEAAWQICRENIILLVMCFVVMFIAVVINYVGQLLVQGVISVVAALAPPLALMIAIGVVLFLAQFVFQMWVQIGQTLFFLKTARGEEASIGLLFAGAPYLKSTVLATLVMAIVVFCMTALLAGLGFGIYAATKEPAAGFAVAIPLLVAGTAYLILTYGASAFLIADQGLGPLESFQVSRQITAGNRLTLVVLALVALVAAAGSILLCCLGYLVMAPFIVLAGTITYLKMAGQITADELLSDRDIGSPFASQSPELR